MSDVQIEAPSTPVSTSVAVAAGYVAGYESGFHEGFSGGFDSGYASNNSAGILLAGIVVGAAAAVWGFLVFDSRREEKR